MHASGHKRTLVSLQLALCKQGLPTVVRLMQLMTALKKHTGGLALAAQVRADVQYCMNLVQKGEGLL